MEWWGWIGVWGLVWIIIGIVSIYLTRGENYTEKDVNAAVLWSTLVTLILSAIVHHFIK